MIKRYLKIKLYRKLDFFVLKFYIFYTIFIITIRIRCFTIFYLFELIFIKIIDFLKK